MEDLSTLRAEVSAWALARLAERSLVAQVDIDELSDNPPPTFAVSAALVCVGELLDVVTRSNRQRELTVLAVVPLGSADAIVLDAPSVAETIEGEWKYGPGLEVPGLYLVDRSVFASYEEVEEYRRPLEPDGISADFSVYYRCWRTTREAERRQEFGRAIYFRSTAGDG